MNPCLFILENNHYGMGTSVERATADDRPRQRSSTPTASSTRRSTAWISTRSCGMRHRAVTRVRETGKPYAIEAMTYRLAPHGAADFLETYRTKDEVKEARKRDPINLSSTSCSRAARPPRSSSRKSGPSRKAMIEDAVRFAEESPEPDPAELYTDVYAIRNRVIGLSMTEPVHSIQKGSAARCR